MQPNVGDVLEGKITGITKFGAFVALPEGKNGLVHISEIASCYVNNVQDHVSEGQVVKVKVISVGSDGRINLSIKQTAASQNKTERPNPAPRTASEKPQASSPSARRQSPAQSGTEPSFEDKLKQFMHESDSRISDSRMYSDKKSGYRRRRD